MEQTESKFLKVGIAGELTDEESVDLIDELAEDVKLFSVSKFSLFPDTEAELKKMSEVDSIILIIKTYHTELDQIIDFVELAQKMNKKILGVVSIECLQIV